MNEKTIKPVAIGGRAGGEKYVGFFLLCLCKGQKTHHLEIGGQWDIV